MLLQITASLASRVMRFGFADRPYGPSSPSSLSIAVSFPDSVASPKKKYFSNLNFGKKGVYYLLLKIRVISESRANRELSRNCECTTAVHESEPDLLNNNKQP